MLFSVLRQPRRFFWNSVPWMKQPPHDRQRYKRQFQEPRHSIPFYDEDPSDTLPQKPVVITGAWGSTNEKVKSERFKHGEQLKSIPTVFDKIRELRHLEHNFWFHSLDLPLLHPEMLHFVQNVSRTVLVDQSLECTSDPAVEAYLRHVLVEERTGLHREMINLRDIQPTAVLARSKQRIRFISSIMEAVYRAVVSSHPDSKLATRANQIDERATVESYTKRLVHESLFRDDPDERLDEDLYNSVNETVYDDEGCVRYRIRTQLAWQLRGPDPLAPFVAPEDTLCFASSSIPQCNYRPEAFELHPVDCFSFECMPFSRNAQSSEFVRTIAGYWSETPFWPGDPCEFGLLGVLDGQRGEQVRRDLKRTALAPAVQAGIVERHTVAEAILTAFAWTSAQAYNQGFTLYNELTYPIAAQLLIVDGDHVQLVRYQLNSLTGCWKPEDAGLPVNIAWSSPRLRLFEHSADDPAQLSVNPQAVSLITSALLQPTRDCPSSQLRPYCPPDSLAPRDQVTLGALTRPRQSLFTGRGSEMDQSGAAAEGNSDTSVLTSGEQTALEETLKGVKVLPRRLFVPPQAHPNDIFFYKLTKKADLMEEIRAAVPSFGGRFARPPPPHDARLRDYKIYRRNSQRTPRVEAPPRRWR